MNLPANILSHLPFLSAVADHQSFTRAAEAMFVSQAAVSYQIRELEMKLSVKLVRRQSGSRLQLTTAGRMLAEEYRACEKRLRMALDQVDPSSLSGELRITVPVDLGSAVLPGALVRLKKLAPKLSIEVSVTDDVVDLNNSPFDFAVRTEKNNPGLNSEYIITSKKSLVVGKEYIKQRGMPMSLSDLKAHTLLIRDRYHRQSTSWKQVFANTDLTVDDCKEIIMLGNTFALVEGARAGLGIAVVPEFSIVNSSSNNDLIRIMDDQTSALTTPFYLCHIAVPQAEPLQANVKSVLLDTFLSPPFLTAFIQDS